MNENPYAAPQSRDLVQREGLSVEEAQALRLRFRGVERLLRSIGIVYFAQALFVTVVSFFLLTNGEGDDVRVVSAAVYCFLLSLVLLAGGYGLRALASWSRLLALLHTMYLLAGFAFGLFALTVNGRVAFVFAVLHALPFYVLFSSRALFVLSARYGDVVAMTPGQRPGSWLLALGIIGVLVALVVVDSLLLAPLWYGF